MISYNLNKQGLDACKMGQYDQALLLLLKASTVLESALGKEHFYTVFNYDCIGLTYEPKKTMM